MHLESPNTSSASSSPKGTKPLERHITLIGMHKRPLFEKLCDAAERFEKHMQFNDIYYLYFNVDGQEVVVELNTVGTEHTGAREMSVRKSDAVILCYAAHSPISFHELANVTEDFTMRKKFPPIILVCNEDELIEEDNLSIDQISTSEGYESDNPGQIKRHHSMEKIRRSQEDSFITNEQGEGFLSKLGPEARFISTSVSHFEGTSDLIMELLRKLNNSRSSTRRRRSTVVEGLKQIALPFQKNKKVREREESNSSNTSDHSPDSASSHSPVDQPSPQSSTNSVPQIEIHQPAEETVFPATKSEPVCKPRSIFRRNQVGGSESQKERVQGSSACSIM